MIAAGPVVAGSSRKRNYRGEKLPETRARATGCPGVAASSPFCSSEQERPLAIAVVADVRSQDCKSATGFRAHGIPFGEGRAEAIIAARGDKAAQEIHERCGSGWLALSRIRFFARVPVLSTQFLSLLDIRVLFA